MLRRTRSWGFDAFSAIASLGANSTICSARLIPFTMSARLIPFTVIESRG